MPKKQRSKKGGGSRRPDSSAPPTDGQLVSVPRSLQQTRRMRVGAVDFFSTDSTPSLAWSSGPSRSVNPSLVWLGGGSTVCPIWTNISHSWDEYRILSIKLHYVPFNRYNRGSVSSGPMVIAYDVEAGVITLPSVPNLLSYGTAVAASLDDPWDVKWDIPTDASKPWYDTGLSISYQPGTFALAAPPTSLTPSVSYGMVHIVLDVLLRGTRSA